MCRIHKYSEKTNVSTGRPKTELLLEWSRKRFGSELHVDGPATANTRPPYVTSRCDGTISWWLAAEQRCCHDAVSETGVQCAVRYCGAVPSWHRRIIMQSLYLTMRSARQASEDRRVVAASDPCQHLYLSLCDLSIKLRERRQFHSASSETLGLYLRGNLQYLIGTTK